MVLSMEHWPIGKLKPYARNPRKNDAQVERMVEAIAEFGFRIPIVARSDGSVVDGHLRLKAAIAMGMTTVPVVLADELSDSQVKAFRLLANQSANWAKWDMGALRLEIEELKLQGFDLKLTGFDKKFFDDLDTSSSLNLPSDFDLDLAGNGIGEDDDTDSSVDSSSPSNIPLSIVLSPKEYQAWGDYKDSLGIRSDSSAFKSLLASALGGGE